MPLTLSILAVVAVGILFTVRVVAATRMDRRNRAYAWVLYARLLVGPTVIALVAVVRLPTDPGLALALGAFGVGFGALIVRMIVRTSAALAKAVTDDDVSTAVTEPLADYVLTFTIVSVLGLIGFGIVAIVWAVSQRGP
jgi:hypothetical protein